jgi:hypothetical protein
MRYKVIYFYLPLFYDMIGSRIHHFDMSEGSSLLTEHPGNIYSDDARDYFLIEGSKDIYRVSTPENPHSNWFVKIVEESDPLFNFDMAYLLGYEDDVNMNINLETYGPSLVPQFVDDKVLRMHH